MAEIIKIHSAIKWNTTLIEQIKQIKADLDMDEYSNLCPHWVEDDVGISCEICVEMFPKIVVHESCPCHHYSSMYLIKRLNEILKYGENIKK